MKIVISLSGNSLDAPFDPRFGRAAFFAIVDTETGEAEVIPNPAINASGGAGIQAAQLIADHQAGAAISGNFGPNAYRALSEAGIVILVAPAGEGLTGHDLVGLYKEGKLTPVTGPTNTGHHQRGGGRMPR